MPPPINEPHNREYVSYELATVIGKTLATTSKRIPVVRYMV